VLAVAMASTDDPEYARWLSVYKDQIAEALGAFQLIEEVIKQYLDGAYKLITHKMKGQLKVSLSIDLLRNRTLRGYVNEFKKYNDNYALISKMERLVNKRNNLAHEALLVIYQEGDGGNLTQLVQQAKKTHKEVKECLGELLEEIRKFSKVCQREGLN
jgi:hypothetical protein